MSFIMWKCSFNIGYIRWISTFIFIGCFFYKQLKKMVRENIAKQTPGFDNFHKFSTKRWFIFLTISNDIDFPSHSLTEIANSFSPPKTRQANLLHTIKLLVRIFCNVNQNPFKEMDQKWYLLLEILATNGFL